MSNTSKTLIRVGELALQTGKSTRALRFYEERGLLKPQSRTASGYRLYDRDSITRIQWIDKMQSMGLSIAEISEVLGSLRGHETGPRLMTAIQQFYSEHLLKTQQDIERLTQLSTQIKSTLNFFDDCTGCTSEYAPQHCISCQQRQESVRMPPMVAALVE